MVAIFGLGISGMEIKTPKIRPSRTKKGIEVKQRRANRLIDSSLDMIIPSLAN